MSTEPLVTADWLFEHLSDDDVVVLDVDEDTTLYDKSHIPGALGLDWHEDFTDPVRRGLLDRSAFERLMDAKGIRPGDHVVIYGGNNNWFAAYAYWTFRLYGHQRLSLLDGGRKLWELRELPMTDEPGTREPSHGYQASEQNTDLRTFRDEVLSHYVGAPAGTALVDVRSPAEFAGDAAAPPHLPHENAQVRGHIPGAANVSWSKAVDPDTGRFLSPEALRDLYAEHGVTEDSDVVTYCRIGERSAHTWFVLHELLGFPKVSNYDGSWTEYGSLIDAPIER